MDGCRLSRESRTLGSSSLSNQAATAPPLPHPTSRKYPTPSNDTIAHSFHLRLADPVRCSRIQLLQCSLPFSRFGSQSPKSRCRLPSHDTERGHLSPGEVLEWCSITVVPSLLLLLLLPPHLEEGGRRWYVCVPAVPNSVSGGGGALCKSIAGCMCGGVHLKLFSNPTPLCTRNDSHASSAVPQS